MTRKFTIKDVPALHAQLEGMAEIAEDDGINSGAFYRAIERIQFPGEYEMANDEVSAVIALALENMKDEDI